MADQNLTRGRKVWKFNPGTDHQSVVDTWMQKHSSYKLIGPPEQKIVGDSPLHTMLITVDFQF